MSILPKEKPKSLKKKKSIKTLKEVRPFLEKDSFEYVRKELKKKYENPVWTDIKTAHKMTVDPIKKKFKNIASGAKIVYDKLRSTKDKKFLGHTDNKNK